MGVEIQLTVDEGEGSKSDKTFFGGKFGEMFDLFLLHRLLLLLLQRLPICRRMCQKNEAAASLPFFPSRPPAASGGGLGGLDIYTPHLPPHPFYVYRQSRVYL